MFLFLKIILIIFINFLRLFCHLPEPDAARVCVCVCAANICIRNFKWVLIDKAKDLLAWFIRHSHSFHQGKSRRLIIRENEDTCRGETRDQNRWMQSIWGGIKTWALDSNYGVGLIFFSDVENFYLGVFSKHSALIFEKSLYVPKKKNAWLLLKNLFIFSSPKNVPLLNTCTLVCWKTHSQMNIFPKIKRG